MIITVINEITESMNMIPVSVHELKIIVRKYKKAMFTIKNRNS